MKVLITNTFKRATRKLHSNQIAELEKAIEQIRKNPTIGESKTGDLAGIRVHKFHMVHQLILLAYIYIEHTKSITLLSLASHENFYENLKKQIKS
jgi:hypothetical protein